MAPTVMRVWRLVLVFLPVLAYAETCDDLRRWSGEWRTGRTDLQFSQTNMNIRGSQYTCQLAQGNLFLFTSSLPNCSYVCYEIVQKHPNILQLRGSGRCSDTPICDFGRENSEQAPSYIIRHSPPVPCPLHTSTSFTFREGGSGGGVCRAELLPGTQRRTTNLNFQNCRTSEQSGGVAQRWPSMWCVGWWQEGSDHYLVTRQAGQEDYTCFTTSTATFNRNSHSSSNPNFHGSSRDNAHRSFSVRNSWYTEIHPGFEECHFSFEQDSRNFHNTERAPLQNQSDTTRPEVQPRWPGDQVQGSGQSLLRPNTQGQDQSTDQFSRPVPDQVIVQDQVNVQDQITVQSQDTVQGEVHLDRLGDPHFTLNQTKFTPLMIRPNQTRLSIQESRLGDSAFTAHPNRPVQTPLLAQESRHSDTHQSRHDHNQSQHIRNGDTQITTHQTQITPNQEHFSSPANRPCNHPFIFQPIIPGQTQIPGHSQVQSRGPGGHHQTLLTVQPQDQTPFVIQPPFAVHPGVPEARSGHRPTHFTAQQTIPGRTHNQLAILGATQSTNQQAILEPTQSTDQQTILEPTHTTTQQTILGATPSTKQQAILEPTQATTQRAIANHPQFTTQTVIAQPQLTSQETLLGPSLFTTRQTRPEERTRHHLGGPDQTNFPIHPDPQLLGQPGPIDVAVHQEPRRVTLSHTQYAARPGGNVILYCSAPVIRDPFMRWVRTVEGRREDLTVNQNVLPSGHEGRMSLHSRFGSSMQYHLAINPVLESDAGNYTCELTNRDRTRGVAHNITLFVGDGCELPESWSGMWRARDQLQPQQINTTHLGRARCMEAAANQFVFRKHDSCNVCYAMKELHPNLLQYAISVCSEASDVRTVCSRVQGPARYLIREAEEGSDPTTNTTTACPFPGHRNFTYQLRHGGCIGPPSTVTAHNNNTELHFIYTPCLNDTDPETPPQVNIVECVANWSEGGVHFLMGRLESSRYVCYTYVRERSEAGGYWMIHQGDDRCTPLDGEWDKWYQLFRSPEDDLPFISPFTQALDSGGGRVMMVPVSLLLLATLFTFLYHRS